MAEKPRVCAPLVRAAFHFCPLMRIRDAFRYFWPVPNAALLQGRPNYTRLIDLERQLRCRKCGARGRASLDVELRPRD
jgi:hypothetical protein